MEPDDVTAGNRPSLGESDPWTILGVRLRNQKPLTNVEIALNPGMTVFAGLNGAGKTLILKGLARALSGKSDSNSGQWQILLRRSSAPLEPRRPGLVGFLDSRLSKHGPDEQGDSFLAATTLLESLLADDDFVLTDRATEVDGQIVAATLDFSRQDVISAIAGTRLWALIGDWRGVRLQPALDPLTESAPVRHFLTDAQQRFEWARQNPIYDEMDEEFDLADFYLAGLLAECNAPWGLSSLEEVEELVNPFSAWALPVPVNPAIGEGLPIPGGSRWPLQIVDVDGGADRDAVTMEALAGWISGDDDQLSLIAGSADYESLEAHLRAAMPDQVESLLQSLPDEARHEVATTRLPRSPHAKANAWSDRASSLLRRLLDVTTGLELEVHPISWWPRGRVARWQGVDVALGERFPIERLSRSQGRWANYAIAATLGAEGVETGFARGNVVIVDEPEAGVHRTAEMHLAQNLKALATRPVFTLIASHSPAFMAEADAVLVVSRNDKGLIQVAPLPGDVIDSVSDLGLALPDVLGWCRNFLLVEGQHDLIVMEELFGPAASLRPGTDLLTATRTRVVPIDGVKGRSASVTASALTQYSDARLVVLVDGVGTDTAATWRLIVERAHEDLNSARKLARRSFLGDNYEASFLRAVATGTDTLEGFRRISVIGLDAPDILELLPVEDFVPGATSWPSLRSDYQKRDRHDKRDFKDWLRKTRSASISIASVRASAQGLQQIPQQLLAVVDELQAAGGQPPGSR